MMLKAPVTSKILSPDGKPIVTHATVQVDRECSSLDMGIIPSFWEPAGQVPARVAKRQRYLERRRKRRNDAP
jgi:hypothetical protein